MSNTIKTNNFDQAKKEIQAMDADMVSKIPSEVDVKDSKHYHVAMIKIMDRPGEVRNEVSVNVQMFHPRSFDKIKSSFRFLGYSKITVIHDPSKKGKVEPVKEPSKEPAKTDDAKSDDLSDQKSGDDELNAVALEVITNGTVDDLDAFAKDNAVTDYPSKGNKSEKQQAVDAWMNAQPKKS